MATLEELVVRIRADASQLDREMKRAAGAVTSGTRDMESSVSRLTGAFRALLPVLSVAAVVEFGKRAIESAGHTVDLADRIGFAAGTLSALEARLAASGASLDDFAASVNLMNANVGQAVSGNQEMVKNFDALGLSVTKLKGMSPEEQFYEITEALAGLKTQYEQTDVGRGIFGRGFAALIPIIKESDGNLRDHVKTVEDLKEAVSGETLARIDAFGDALSNAAIRAKNAFLEAFGVILDVADKVDAFLKERGAGNYLETARGIVGTSVIPGLAAFDQYQKYKTHQKQFENPIDEYTAADVDEYGVHKPSAKGNNRDLLKGKGAGGGAGTGLAIPADYDDSQFEKYLRDLREEQEALGLSERALTVRRTLIEAQNMAREDEKKGMADAMKNYEAEKDHIAALAGSFYDLRKAQEENQRQAQQWRDQLTDGLTDVVLHFDSATDAARGFFDQIAGQVLRKGVTGPISDALIGTDGKGGLLDGVFSGLGNFLSGKRDTGGGVAQGGTYLVGESGPELFSPTTSGYVTPNNKLGGGGGITVHHTWNISPGVEGTVQAELRRAAPDLVNAAMAGTLAAIERGGRASQAVGRRN